ncbi:MAG: HU family DNA-binding protein [Gemmatimonadota bacterium]
MTKQEFAEKLARKTGTSKAMAMDAIDAIFSTKPGHGIIAIELDAGRDFTITGFGTFKTRRTKARMGRNPQTGAAIQIPARNSVSFRAGKGLKTRVRDEATTYAGSTPAQTPGIIERSGAPLTL